MLPSQVHDWVPALLGGLSAFADAILGVGIIVPGETVIVGLAVTVDRGGAAPLIGMVAIGASLGDHLNYGLGRALGGRLPGSRLVAALGVQRWERGVRLLRRHGVRAIVLSRPVPGVRTLVPAAAGVAGLAYRRFLPASLAGSLIWAVAWVLAGRVVSFVVTNPALLAALPVIALATAVLPRRVRGSHGGDR